MKQGYLIVLSAPSGTGKTTICKELLNRNKKWKFSISATTREKRKDEKDGVDYIFMSKDKFKTRLQIAKNKISKKNFYKKTQNSTSIGAAFKLSTELVSAVAVGTIIGFILDNTFDTKPWLIIIFFFVGVVAGIINVIRSAKKNAKID